ncbi:MAG: hypothetical protein A3G34_16260 [Candidatus Lindowbacteria bacterium RIFCSPLOWO2_12_FULL_62_27]|nr:MAG: hypothetical protein A3I06_03595 [Candidatus Lindowbacteria bacterium RIFCSPLOWO2_02_FULL_62_12]OGH60478.1 MAG: hypothetical protein A3G34_16260 [Candidatus Lindowbacteria bacterium RIFCSPLOWO2_12_FULL_62_27]
MSRIEQNILRSLRIVRPGGSFKLAYKIHVLVTLVVIVVEAVIVFFALAEYRTSMYEQLLRRSFNNLQTVDDRFQARLWTRTGRLRGMTTKSLTAKTRLPQELVYQIEKVFDAAIQTDPSITYFILYTRAGAHVYPGAPRSKAASLRQDAAAVQHIEHVGARYNEHSGYIEVYRTLLDKEQNPWARVEMGVNPSVVRDGILRTIWSSVVIAWVAAIAGLYAAFRFSDVILVPIQRLRKTAESLSAGDLTQRATVTTRDEIADLSASFNTMADHLQKRIEDLRAIQMLSTEISATLTQNDLQRVIAQTFHKIAHADFCALLARADHSSVLTVAAGIGVANSELQMQTATPVLAEACGHSREVLTTIAAAPDLARLFLPDGPALAAPLPGTTVDRPLVPIPPPPPSAPLMVLPFIYDGEVRSVLLLGGEKLKKEDEDINFFRTLSGHASVALQNARLYQLSITDGLTGLYLRRHFLFELERLLTPPADGGRLALLMTDIDHFKNVNDSFGHPEGDFILIHVARTIWKTLRTHDVTGTGRAYDMVGRYGGEEFIALVRNVTPEGAQRSAERVRAAIEGQVFKSDKREHRITTSVGVCPFQPGLTVQDWIDRADQALYQSKSGGRNRVTVYHG